MTWVEEKADLAGNILRLLYEHRMIRTFYRDKPEGWTLVSGLYSPLYIQLRPLLSYPAVFKAVCIALGRLIQEEAPHINKIVGIAMAGVPLASGLSAVCGIPAAFTRKIQGVTTVTAFREAISSYGEHSSLEGDIQRGDNIALLDDLVTRFDSKLVAMEQVRYELKQRELSHITCKTVIVALDREQGGKETAAEHDLELLSLIKFKTEGLELLKKVMNPTEWRILHAYLNDPDHFQDPEVRKELFKSAMH